MNFDTNSMRTGECQKCGRIGLLLKVPVHDENIPVTYSSEPDGLVNVHLSIFKTLLWCAGCCEQHRVGENIISGYPDVAK